MTKSRFKTATRWGQALAGMPLYSILLLCLLLICAACASVPTVSDGDRPTWTKETARAVESGQVVHLGQGKDENTEMAMRQAEAQALQNVANECSFVPKGTRVVERAVTKTPTGLHAWAKVSLALEACEDAKRAVEPKAIRRLAHVEFTNQVYRYQHGQIDHELLSSLADSGDDEGAVAPPPAPIRDEIHLYVVRQQIAFAKQEIILSENARDPAVAMKSTAKHIEARTMNLRRFEEAHPEFKRTPRNWSNYGREAVLHSPWVSPLVRQPNPPVGKERAARWLNLRAAEESSTERTKIQKKSMKKKVKKVRAKRAL